MPKITTKTRNRTRNVPNRKDVGQRLRDMAIERGPAAKLPTAAELCTIIGTTTRTLNDAMRELEADNVIYRRQGSGIYVSPSIHRKKIAVLLAYSYFRLPGASPFWNMLYHMFTMEAERRSKLRDIDYEFIIEADAQDSSRLQVSLAAAAKRGQIDGIIAVGTMGSMRENLDAENIPIVSYAVDGNWGVLQDTLELIRLGVETLWAQGCRRIGFWAPRLSDSTATSDYDAAVKALERVIKVHGGEVDPADCICGSDIRDEFGEIGTYQEQGYRVGMSVFGGSAPKPDGIVIADDMMTSGAIAVAYKLGIRLGEDIWIATAANAGSPLLFGYAEYLTLMEYSPEQIVRALCDMVETLLDGNVPDQQFITIKPVIRRGKV